VRITTYKELTEYYENFLKGNFPFIIIKARGGIGKTFQIEKMVEESKRNVLFFKGHATPLSIYMALYKNNVARVVFDDVDQLLKNKTIIALLKQICDLKEEKKVYYSTTAKLGEEIPPEFTSKNKVMLITNQLGLSDDNMKALLTRALFIDFEPSNQEVFNIMVKFPKTKKEEEIINFMVKFQNVSLLNFRDYEHLKNLMYSNIDYKRYYFESKQINTEEYKIKSIAVQYKTKYINKAEALKQIQNIKGCSERTAYRTLKEAQ
jgi:hypothetical protein